MEMVAISYAGTVVKSLIHRLCYLSVLPMLSPVLPIGTTYAVGIFRDSEMTPTSDFRLTKAAM